MSSLFDVDKIRKDFPALHQTIHSKPLVYLDNAATTQKPLSVVDAIRDFYLKDCSNIHRGVHELSERATRDYEEARVKVQEFIRAAHSREIIFVRGTTEAINLVAHSYGRAHLKTGDEIVVSALEHHSNIVPWQLLCEEKGARLKVIPMNDQGELDLKAYTDLLNSKVRLVALPHVSNALGTVIPIKEMIRLAHEHNIPVLIDGAQAVSHLEVDVVDLDVDFYAFSGHKLYGPTGIGVLYGKTQLLEAMPPYQGGGDMIESVTFEKTTYNGLPYKFEAGTPDIAGVIGLGAAIDYVNHLGLKNIAAYENELLEYATKRLAEEKGIELVGTAKDKVSVLSFLMEGVHPHDVGTILDQEGVAIRTGHHCAQPVMDRLNIAATCRASFALYNTKREIDALVQALRKVREVFGS